jgi:hypothetical protein
MPDGSLLYSQPEYLGPYHIRNDLYLQKGGSETRLTVGERLTAPDVRADGRIVAVQDEPGTTRLVLLRRDPRTLTPLTSTTLEVQWADPRWSPDGSRVAAVRQARGRSEIVVLDTVGKVIDTFGATSAINSSPSWSPDGRRIYFSSERTGSPQIYVADVTNFAPTVARVTDVATGLFNPELSPDQTHLATLLFKADGFHLGVTPVASLTRIVSADSARTSPRVGCTNCLAIVPGLPPLGTADSSRATDYSPWLSLLPRYWIPAFEGSNTDGTSFGLVTSGADIVGRHDYTVEVLRNSKWAENSAWLWYRYAGFGLPLIDLYASQNYSNANVVFSDQPTGPSFGFSERERIVSLMATFIRPRFRTYTVASIGGELEGISYSTTPDTMLQHLSSFYSQGRSFPALVASAGWSNARRPALAISPEDGLSISISGRQRWRAGTSGGSTRSAIGISSLYKSLDLPGFAHHVLALRAAGAITDDGSPDLFSAGGISGTSLEVFPGVSVGQQRRVFGVRGYPVGSESGTRAYAGTVEYRAPLFAPSRGFRFIPVFVDRTSFTFFGETARAFCPSSADVVNGVCSASRINNPVMSSAGAELNIDTGLQLDLQARLRLGVAFPIANREALGASSAQFYGTFGASF